MGGAVGRREPELDNGGGGGGGDDDDDEGVAGASAEAGETWLRIAPIDDAARSDLVESARASFGRAYAGRIRTLSFIAGGRLQTMRVTVPVAAVDAIVVGLTDLDRSWATTDGEELPRRYQGVPVEYVCGMTRAPSDDLRAWVDHAAGSTALPDRPTHVHT
ncbi:Uncharacterized protein PBTT_09069 [Plasmodiophora brassicae]